MKVVVSGYDVADEANAVIYFEVGNSNKVIIGSTSDLTAVFLCPENKESEFAAKVRAALNAYYESIELKNEVYNIIAVSVADFEHELSLVINRSDKYAQVHFLCTLLAISDLPDVIQDKRLFQFYA